MKTQAMLYWTIMALALSSLFMERAHADIPFKVCSAQGVCGQAYSIDEDQLAAVAGKFTVGGEVVGMNLMMTSSWQAANGQRLEGAASVSIGLPGSGNPHIGFGTQAVATEPQEIPAPADTTVLVVHGRDARNISGAAQIIQVAGDGNGASNRTAIEFGNNDVGSAAGNAVPYASAKASNGAQVRATVGNNGVSLDLQLPGAGAARQQVNMGASGTISQNIQITADRQQVLNQLHLQVQMRRLSAASEAAQGVARSLNMLRGR